MTMLVVSETFAPTVQGEGPSTGRRAGFIRLGRCNLDCSWCDTPFTWDWRGKNGVAYDPAQELRSRSVGELVALMGDVGLVVVTGGEPMLQREGLTALVAALVADGRDVEIETNGTIAPWPELRPARFNVSPKLSSSGVARRKAWKSDALRALLASDSVFKFVIGCSEDLREVECLAGEASIPAQRIWLMCQTPFGASVPSIAEQDVATAALSHGYNYTDRLHVRLWGQKRGH